MLMLGCRPAGRNTEQHDIFFGIGESVKDLVPAIKAFWPEAKSNIHVDAWREVTQVNGYRVQVKPKTELNISTDSSTVQLYFINLGGYKVGEFDEFHYKMLVAAPSIGDATKQARQSAFYKHTGFKGAESHIDDKFGIDVDELMLVNELLSDSLNQEFSLQITSGYTGPEDEMHLGYFQLHKL